MRRDLRLKYDLREAPTSDCCAYFLCAFCAICQEARELKRQKMAPLTSGDPGTYQPVAAGGPESHPAPMV